MPERVFVGSHGNFDGTRPGEHKCAKEKLITTSRKILDTNGTYVLGSPITGVFTSFGCLNSPGKNAPKKDAYINNMEQINPGIATPYAHVLLFTIVKLYTHIYMYVHVHADAFVSRYDKGSHMKPD